MPDQPTPTTPTPPTCAMVEGCTAPITHIDDKGYVYCREHGRERQAYRRCRQLRPAELRRVLAGEPLERY